MLRTPTRSPATVGVLACVTAMSCANVIVHDERSAARAAELFGNAAFVARNSQKAFAQLAGSLQRQLPLDAFTQSISAMHPSGYPDKLRATHYEPIPGTDRMNILLEGSNSANKHFYYRVQLQGGMTGGYKVVEFKRGNRPYPSPHKRPIAW